MSLQYSKYSNLRTDLCVMYSALDRRDWVKSLAVQKLHQPDDPVEWSAHAHVRYCDLRYTFHKMMLQC
jgi:hypothetical protein